MRIGLPLLDLEVNAETYAIEDVDRILTPALIIYPALVDANIKATLRMLGNDPNRWRPHIKTAKLSAILQRLIEHSVLNFKCSTTLELLSACRAGAADVLLAFPVVNANAQRTVEIADQFPRTRVSVLIETAGQAASWSGTTIGIFVDVNPGMDRTGIGQERVDEIVALARQIKGQFRGLHYYDGHMSAFALADRESHVHKGYDQLLRIANALQSAGIEVGELITSGTPATPFATTYNGFRPSALVHRVSPGTVVFNDTTSLEQLPPEYGYVPAAAVLSTVVSRPTPRHVTCDAGHKSVSADAGVPTCAVIGRPDLKPLKPSEEHLPIESLSQEIPKIGDRLYLIPRHVCPTVNNFDQALFVVHGQIKGLERVTARGHEDPLTLVTEHQSLSVST